MAKRWTNDDIQQLKKLAQHYPAPKIAEMIDRTVGGVVFKAHTLKISLRSSCAKSMDPGGDGFEMQH